MSEEFLCESFFYKVKLLVLKKQLTQPNQKQVQYPFLVPLVELIVWQLTYLKFILLSSEMFSSLNINKKIFVLELSSSGVSKLIRHYSILLLREPRDKGKSWFNFVPETPDSSHLRQRLKNVYVKVSFIKLTQPNFGTVPFLDPFGRAKHVAMSI